MQNETSFLREQLKARPWWMNILFVWCILLALGVPIELLTRPVAEDVEVWFGIEFMGWAAKAGGLLHAIIFAVGTWAALYVAQVALSHLVWSELSPHGRGWPIGLLQTAGISIIVVLLWRARPLFQNDETPAP